MKFAPFILILYYNFGTFQLPGSLPLPSVPPFPTSWETLQVVCCPIWLSSKYNVLFNSALPLPCSEPKWKYDRAIQRFFGTKQHWLVCLHLFISVMNGEGGGGGMEQKNTAIQCVILQETAARLLFMAVSFHIFILFPFLSENVFHLSFFPMLGPYLAWFLKFVIYPEIAISFCSKRINNYGCSGALGQMFSSIPNFEPVWPASAPSGISWLCFLVGSLFKNNSWKLMAT